MARFAPYKGKLDDAIKGGETPRRLFAVTAWREAPFFTERERAALLWTETPDLMEISASALEAGYGIPDDKREKNRFAAEDVWNYFRGLRTVGVVSESRVRHLEAVASR